MSKVRKNYVCQACGSVHTKWSGKCEGCSEWNSITEELNESVSPLTAKRKKGSVIEFQPLKGESLDARNRLTSSVQEFDRVCGGGLVKGSITLIGGDPGIGKSTLLLQIVCHLAAKDVRCAYISGEEAVDQVRLRAKRLGLENTPVHLAASSNMFNILETLEATHGANPFDVVVIDSIQTMYLDALESAPGTVSQVRACAHELIKVAKKRNIIVLMVGHVTKEGNIAGPRVLEHMVDTVLYFEGERGHHFRILRSVKNRFGPTDEIGVFEMAEKGLMEVPNPSELFLSGRRADASGTVVFAGIEGTRPVLVELQALVAPSVLGTPRRAVIGWDSGRLSMILAVLEARCGLNISMNDIYLNIAGGLKISEPAADLAAACALVSSFTGIPLAENTVIFGELGLSGEIRSVSQMALRVKEANKLGFHKAITSMPPRTASQGDAKMLSYAPKGFELEVIEKIEDIIAMFQKNGYNGKRKMNVVTQRSQDYGDSGN